MEVGHACLHGVVPWADVTTYQVVVGIPNGKNLKIVDTDIWNWDPFYPEYKELGPASPDAKGHDWAIPWVKPINSASFKTVHPFYDKITQVNLWGEALIDQAPRSVAWASGKIQQVNIDDVRMIVQLPEIPKESCVEKVNYVFPAVQYCGRSSEPNAMPIMGWLLGTTGKFHIKKIGETEAQWAPSLQMARNLEDKPLPRSCGAGKTITVYPDKADIDTYLMPVEVDKDGTVTRKSLAWWFDRIGKK